MKNQLKRLNFASCSLSFCGKMDVCLWWVSDYTTTSYHRGMRSLCFLQIKPISRHRWSISLPIEFMLDCTWQMVLSNPLREKWFLFICRTPMEWTVSAWLCRRVRFLSSQSLQALPELLTTTWMDAFLIIKPFLVLFCSCWEVYWVGLRFVFNSSSPAAFSIEAGTAKPPMRPVLPKSSSC